nr:aminopeptidase P family protein [Anaerolineae bacterium]
MKSDLDRLMEERGFAAIVVMGEARGNHILKYLTNGAQVSHAIVVKKRHEQPAIICGGMERDEAAKSGLPVVTMAAFNYTQLVKEAGSGFEGSVRLMGAIFEKYGITGKVSFYGTGDPGRSYMMLKRLAEYLPDIEVVGETETSIFDEAYATKDGDEIDAIKSIAQRTNTVMGEIIAFLQGHKVAGETLLKADGSPLTVADVKAHLRQRLLHYGLEDNGETIFALGRDAGVPHSRGEDGDVLALGKSIIFDLFPRDMVSGYYHDMTRTFCLGYAPDEVQMAYKQVMQAFNVVMDKLEVGQKGGYYQDLTCDVFEEHGHPTIRTNPGAEEGYVHSVGHGLGLQIHSRPRMSTLVEDTLEVGHVITIEPGLYYPSRGYGVRIEDTVYVDEKGQFHSLTPYPKDLIIPVGN